MPSKPVNRKVKAVSIATPVVAFLVMLIVQTFPALSGMEETLTSLVGAILVSATALVSGWITKQDETDQGM